MKTIIAEKTQQETILRNLAKKTNGIVNNVSVISLSTAMKEENDDTIATAMVLCEALNESKDDFPIFSSMFNYPAFIQEILSFTKECILYQIEPEELPVSNANEEELKRILQISLRLPSATRKNVKRKEYQIQKLQKRENITLSYSFFKDSYHYAIYKQLSASIPSISYPDNNPAVSLKYALNARSEAEAIAQNICNTNQPCNIILTNPSSQLPLYESVLERYQIPYTSLVQSKNLHFPLILSSLLLLGIQKDKASFLDALRYHAFKQKCPPDIYDFFKTTLTSTDMPADLSEIQNNVFEKELERYNQQYEKAQAYYTEIEPDLNELLSSNTTSDILYAAFAIARKSDYLKDQIEMTSAIQIRKTIIECSPYIQTTENLVFLAHALQNVTASTQTSLSDFCTITDLTHPVDPKPFSYVVSVSGTNYPGVPVNTGLFDEGYVEKISSYPSQSKRYNQYMEQLQWLEHSATSQLIYSHYTNDYQGREIQLAFEIENQFKNIDTKWKIVSLPPVRNQIHELSADIAEKLFTKDDKILGSVSSIERFFACPYSYFIQAGLHVHPQQTASLDASYIGTIQHKVLEQSIQNKGKQYAEITKEEIESYIKDTFIILDLLSPTQTILNHITKERMISSLWNACQFLADFEKNSSFEPAQIEYKFKEDITEHVTLRGAIDRLDIHANDMLRIIDYKSSLHSLSENTVKTGQQLQLLSYLIIAKRIFHLDPSGAYYFSLKDASYDVQARKLAKSEVNDTEWEENEEFERMLNARRLKGWTFTDRTTEMDENRKHITSVNKQMNYDEVEDCILSLYELFYQQVTEGNITLAPTENACAFCEYTSICRFHGERRKTKPLVKQDVKFSKGKEEE